MSSILDALNKLEEEKAQQDAVDDIDVYLESDQAAIDALTSNFVTDSTFPVKTTVLIGAFVLFTFALVAISVGLSALLFRQEQPAPPPLPPVAESNLAPLAPTELPPVVTPPTDPPAEAESAVVENDASADSVVEVIPAESTPTVIELLVEDQSSSSEQSVAVAEEPATPPAARPTPEPEPEPSSPEISLTTPIESELSDDGPEEEINVAAQPVAPPPEIVEEIIVETPPILSEPVEESPIADGASGRRERLRLLKEQLASAQNGSSSTSTQAPSETSTEEGAATPVAAHDLPVLSSAVKARYGLEGILLNVPLPVSPTRPRATAMINMLKYWPGEKVGEYDVRLMEVERDGVVLEVIGTNERYFLKH